MYDKGPGVVTLTAVITVISHCQGLRGGRGEAVRDVVATSVHAYSAIGLATFIVLYC